MRLHTRLISTVATSAQEVCAYGRLRRGQGKDETTKLVEKLVEAMGFSSTASSAYSRSLAVLILDLACRLYESPPKTLDELIARLDYIELRRRDESGQLRGVDPEEIDAVAVRCAALRVERGNSLDFSPRPVAARLAAAAVRASRALGRLAFP